MSPLRMVENLRAPGSARITGSQWRGLAGLGIVLVAIAQSAVNVQDPTRLEMVIGLTLIMTAGWILQLGPWKVVGVWMLGSAACALMLVMPGSGAVIGLIGALVTAGLRLPAGTGALAAGILGPLFVMIDLWQTRAAPNPVATALSATGLAFAYVAAISVRRIREERERAEALLEELQRTRAAEIERAALTERTRIAREIHDVLAHTLSSLAVQLEGTRMLVEQRPGDPAAVAAVERAHRLASEGLAEARRAIGALRGDNLPGPEGLQKLVQEFSEATSTPSQFEVSGEPIALGAEAQLALYRTAQEALTNVRKHAQAASAVEVRLRYADDGAELLVVDAAPPGRSTNGSTKGGYGLVGMRERAELVGGTLEAGPLPTGFRVRLWLPRG
ncbi:MAG: sensor histidine kinase [Chloroflexi bacterium]|nr:sensor histidine kinase [Chloroflexota bacterium]